MEQKKESEMAVRGTKAARRLSLVLAAACVCAAATGCANGAAASSGAASFSAGAASSVAAEASSAESAVPADQGTAVPVGSETSADLDGNGTPETIYYAADSDDEENPVHSLSVNGTEYKKGLINNGTDDTCIYFPDCTNYYIVDLDASDSYKEIAIQDFGPSDDPTTFFFRYDGKSLKCLGYVTDLLSSESCTLDHAGTVHARLRLSLLQTWFTTGAWSVQGDALQLAPQDLYTPWFYDGTTDFSEAPQVTIAKSVKVYADRDTSSSAETWEPSDALVTFPATDNAEWVEIERGGKTGWIHITDFCVLDNDGETDATTVFNGLLLAD
jgi:hypothetical protein